MTGQQLRPAVAYGDGRGYLRIYCLTCPRPSDVNVPFDINIADHWERCTGCGRYVVDIARDQAKEAAP